MYVLFRTPFPALGTISLLCSGYRRLFFFYRGCGTGHSLLCRAKVAYEWVCTATFRVYLFGVCRDVTFTFYKSRRVSVCLRLDSVTSLALVLRRSNFKRLLAVL